MIEMFGGLNFVSATYYDFVLKLEYVFVRCLTSTKLAVLGSSLVQRVYNDICVNIYVRQSLVNVMRVDDELEDEIMDDLVAYLVHMYCHMRGEYFCRNIMATNFTSLGK